MTLSCTMLLIVAILLVIFSSKRIAALTILCTACYFNVGALLLIGGMHLSCLRIVIIFALLRIAVRREAIHGGYVKMDKLMILYAIMFIITGILQERTILVSINRFAISLEIIGVFFAFRSLLTQNDDLVFVIKGFSLAIVPLAILVVAEKLTGFNYFSIWGGASPVAIIRDGKIRASGSFSHPILLGTFAASSFPIVLALWWNKKRSKMLAILGSLSCVAIVFASNSSGPIMQFALCIIGIAMWPFRLSMRKVRWLIVFGLIGLQCIMKAPVWYLLARFNLTGASTGWYRAELISSAFAHINEWWIIGTNYTRHWMATGVPNNPNACDMTNHYLLVGTFGGLFLMFIFIALIVECFSQVGRVVMNDPGTNIQNEVLPWMLGTTLFSHVVTFFSICYFGQMMTFVYFLFAVTTYLFIAKRRTSEEKEV